MTSFCRDLVIAALLLVSAAGPAAASEYCVVCYTPDARYRCMTSDGRDGQGTDQRAWMQCISQLAKAGGHESCSIDGASTAPCLGVVKPIDMATIDGAPEGQGLPAPPPRTTTAPQPAPYGEPEVRPADAPAPAEPGIIEKSKESIENAGSAVGNAAKKSWDCMSSLFKKC